MDSGLSYLLTNNSDHISVVLGSRYGCESISGTPVSGGVQLSGQMVSRTRVLLITYVTRENSNLKQSGKTVQIDKQNRYYGVTAELACGRLLLVAPPCKFCLERWKFSESESDPIEVWAICTSWFLHYKVVFYQTTRWHVGLSELDRAGYQSLLDW